MSAKRSRQGRPVGLTGEVPTVGPSTSRANASGVGKSTGSAVDPGSFSAGWDNADCNPGTSASVPVFAMGNTPTDRSLQLAVSRRLCSTMTGNDPSWMQFIMVHCPYCAMPGPKFGLDTHIFTSHPEVIEQQMGVYRKRLKRKHRDPFGVPGASARRSDRRSGEGSSRAPPGGSKTNRQEDIGKSVPTSTVAANSDECMQLQSTHWECPICCQRFASQGNHVHDMHIAPLFLLTVLDPKVIIYLLEKHGKNALDVDPICQRCRAEHILVICLSQSDRDEHMAKVHSSTRFGCFYTMAAPVKRHFESLSHGTSTASSDQLTNGTMPIDNLSDDDDDNFEDFDTLTAATIRRLFPPYIPTLAALNLATLVSSKAQSSALIVLNRQRRCTSASPPAVLPDGPRPGTVPKLVDALLLHSLSVDIEHCRSKFLTRQRRGTSVGPPALLPDGPRLGTVAKLVEALRLHSPSVRTSSTRQWRCTSAGPPALLPDGPRPGTVPKLVEALRLHSFSVRTSSTRQWRCTSAGPPALLSDGPRPGTVPKLVEALRLHSFSVRTSSTRQWRCTSAGPPALLPDGPRPGTVPKLVEALLLHSPEAGISFARQRHCGSIPPGTQSRSSRSGFEPWLADALLLSTSEDGQLADNSSHQSASLSFNHIQIQNHRFYPLRRRHKSCLELCAHPPSTVKLSASKFSLRMLALNLRMPDEVIKVFMQLRQRTLGQGRQRRRSKSIVCHFPVTSLRSLPFAALATTVVPALDLGGEQTRLLTTKARRGEKVCDQQRQQSCPPVEFEHYPQLLRRQEILEEIVDTVQSATLEQAAVVVAEGDLQESAVTLQLETGIIATPASSAIHQALSPQLSILEELAVEQCVISGKQIPPVVDESSRTTKGRATEDRRRETYRERKLQMIALNLAGIKVNDPRQVKEKRSAESRRSRSSPPNISLRRRRQSKALKAELGELIKFQTKFTNRKVKPCKKRKRRKSGRTSPVKRKRKRTVVDLMPSLGTSDTPVSMTNPFRTQDILSRAVVPPCSAPGTSLNAIICDHDYLSWTVDNRPDPTVIFCQPTDETDSVDVLTVEDDSAGGCLPSSSKIHASDTVNCLVQEPCLSTAPDDGIAGTEPTEGIFERLSSEDAVFTAASAVVRSPPEGGSVAPTVATTDPVPLPPPPNPTGVKSLYVKKSRGKLDRKVEKELFAVTYCAEFREKLKLPGFDAESKASVITPGKTAQLKTTNSMKKRLKVTDSPNREPPKRVKTKYDQIQNMTRKRKANFIDRNSKNGAIAQRAEVPSKKPFTLEQQTELLRSIVAQGT